MKKEKVCKHIPFHLTLKFNLILGIIFCAFAFIYIAVLFIPRPNGEYDFLPRVWPFIFLILVLHTVYTFTYRLVLIKNWMTSFDTINLIDYRLRHKLIIKREDFLRYPQLYLIKDDEKIRASLLLNEKNFIISRFYHPNLLNLDIQFELSSCTWDDAMPVRTLKDFMFTSVLCKDMEYIDMIRYMKDVLKGIMYLHERRIYHLDLQPKNVLIVKTPQSQVGDVAKIAGFSFAKRIESKKVPTAEVGLTGFYRPPEYYTSSELDAEKFDTWGVGLTAFEVFLGGGLSIESMCGQSEVSTSFQVIKMHEMLDQEYFASAMDVAWDIGENFLSHFFKLKVKVPMYDLIHIDLIPECRDFVTELMKFDPSGRMSLEQAINMPVMKKVRYPPYVVRKKKWRVLHV